MRATAKFSDDGATFSDAGQYRLLLDIEINAALSRVACALMMNPSTAHVVDGRLKPDRTISKFCGYAAREGCGRLLVVNAFGIVLTDSKLLHKTSQPTGNPLNNDCIADALERADLIIAGWGRLHKTLRWRDTEVREILRHVGKPVHALAINDDGSPGHPLYLSSDAPLLDFRP